MHFKELQAMDWLGLVMCVAVLVLIWLVSKPPWPPLPIQPMTKVERVLIWLLALLLVAGAWMLFTAGNVR